VRRCDLTITVSEARHCAACTPRNIETSRSCSRRTEIRRPPPVSVQKASMARIDRVHEMSSADTQPVSPISVEPCARMPLRTSYRFVRVLRYDNAAGTLTPPDEATDAVAGCVITYEFNATPVAVFRRQVFALLDIAPGCCSAGNREAVVSFIRCSRLDRWSHPVRRRSPANESDSMTPNPCAVATKSSVTTLRHRRSSVYVGLAGDQLAA
jgi:hypothetical protein